ncbi:MAG: hypothetical protein IKP06_03655 [Elusimicrobiaceae bacterium]|nr:hypothetical protein [Elusimicrobiaceae bacterium]
MKNRWMIALLACVICLPAFAAEPEKAAAAAEKPAVEMHKCPYMDGVKKGEFKKAQKEHRAKMKATEEKMEKLVKEYKKLKGKKQETKKAEIVAEIATIHEEQLKFKQAQLEKFEKRLAEMKKHVQEEQTAEAKKAWAEKKTDELIEAGGDLKVLFEGPKRGAFGPGQDGKRFHKGFKGMRKHGPKPGEVGILPPPPPPVEEK